MLTAQDIMTSKVITVTEDVPVTRLAAILWENRISGVPVVDDKGEVISVVTENDLIDQTKKLHLPTVISVLDSVIFLENPNKVEKDIEKITGKTVKDICSKNPVIIALDTRLDEIATIMAEKKVHTLPVVSEGKLVGVVGKSDIIRTLTKKD
ncbi:MAG: CBS domain-containing protein [Desulfobulbaceae bacterium]|nr:CBS domain-containing protein [Desulfobulbaceae bacterium]MCK5339486.1 CBS domain-containing protein [Desulfobulbaceae bacterium]